MENIIKEAINQHKQSLNFIETQYPLIEKIANLCLVCLKNKGKIIFIGNGGSAADSQHLAAELVGRFKLDGQALPGLALTTDTSILTAVGNDYGFEEIFARQIEALASDKDLVISLSTSGNSLNIIKAINKAKSLNIKTIGFLGKDGGELVKLVDLALVIPSKNTPSIQEMHILVGHIICEIIDDKLRKK